MIKLTWKIWLLIVVILLSLLSIFGIPNFQKGVVITSVEANSTAFDSGLRKGQIITEIDGSKISNVADFGLALEGKFDTNQSRKIIIKTDKIEAVLFSNIPPQITVSEIPQTNIKTGLDLSGGARALVQAKDKQLSSSEVSDLADVINNRINVYGIEDVNVVPISDLSGNNFILVEIAGATPKDLENLISQQGKFEAKIANETIFIGGQNGVTSVCKNDARCAGIENCAPSQSGYTCTFRFTVYLSQEAAQKHADVTKNLGVNVTPQGNYLTKPLDLYLDDKIVETLLISDSLKGRVTTEIAISGSGSGTTSEEAYNTAQQQMHNLQTILITGSLPYKLEIVKLDTVSPNLGKDFTRAIFIAGIASFLAVSIIIFFRYKKIKTSLALLLTSFSEIIIILGIAALIKWNIDLPGIAGILATIGTGVDQQIVVIDEAKHGKILSLKEKMKRAFAIILGSYFTVFVSMLPLLWAGAGLLKGFAVTTLIGITAGVLITRPAFTDLIRKIEE
ncbi:MAG: PDZ domain-containing protein [Nanoarchaeota archaeon]